MYDDVLYLCYLNRDGEYTIYCYIDCGAKNGFGGMVRNTYYIADGKIIGTENEFDSMSFFDDDFDELAYAKLAYLTWAVNGDRRLDNENGGYYGVLYYYLVPKEMVMEKI